MSLLDVLKCSACGGSHARLPLQHDKSGPYFVCVKTDPRAVDSVRRFIDGTGKSGARVEVERELLST